MYSLHDEVIISLDQCQADAVKYILVIDKITTISSYETLLSFVTRSGVTSVQMVNFLNKFRIFN